MHAKHANLTIVAIQAGVTYISDINTIKMYQPLLPLVVNRSAVKIELKCYLVNHIYPIVVPFPVCETKTINILLPNLIS